MSRRFYGYMLIEFTDGSNDRVGGNRDRIADGVLQVYTDDGYGQWKDIRNYPLANIKEYHWEER
jgi:hypothetical protein